MAKKTGRIIRNVILVVLCSFVIIQFIRPKKNNDTTVTPDDITMLYPMSDSVHQILEKACYDCHSNNTTYPWYFNIQPVAWWMNGHIDDGKKELNFSEFGKRPVAKRAKKLQKIAKEVQSGGMPLDSYTWIHKNAILTDQEKKMVEDWANNAAQIAAQVPAK